MQMHARSFRLLIPNMLATHGNWAHRYFDNTDTGINWERKQAVGRVFDGPDPCEKARPLPWRARFLKVSPPISHLHVKNGGVRSRVFQEPFLQTRRCLNTQTLHAMYGMYAYIDP